MVGSHDILGLLVACWVLCCCHCWQVVGNISAGFVPMEETDLSMVKNGRRQIIPGTKWCGAGNIAHQYSDLGSFKDTDACCREHDQCSDVIAPGDTKHGLHNDGQFTRLLCDCDARFWSCLYRVGSLPSILVNLGYFELLTSTCFRLDHPITGCLVKGPSILKSKCLEYEYERSGEKRHQWFDSVPLLDLFAADPEAGATAALVRGVLSLCPWAWCSRRASQDASMADSARFIN